MKTKAELDTLTHEIIGLLDRKLDGECAAVFLSVNQEGAVSGTLPTNLHAVTFLLEYLVNTQQQIHCNCPICISLYPKLSQVFQCVADETKREHGVAEGGKFWQN